LSVGWKIESEVNMESTHGDVGWGFWLLWVVVTTVGMAVGTVAGFFLGVAAIQGQGTVSGGLQAGAVVGAVVGLMQWLLLRWRRVRHTGGWWVVPIVLGGVAGAFLATAEGNEGYVALAVLPTVGLGIWLLLRRWQASRAGCWALASTVGAAGAATVSLLTVGMAAYEPMICLGMPIILPGVGGLTGSITGIMLFGLPRT
jgi:hypothetical protein